MPFQGFAEPTYTQIPNEWFVLLPQIETEAEDKVTQVVMRFTFGFHRKSARLSLSFLEQATGLSRPSVIAGIKAAVKRKTIRRDKKTSRIEINFLPGSKASLLADSKASLPEGVKQVYPRKKKEATPPINKRARRPLIQGLMAKGGKRD